MELTSIQEGSRATGHSKAKNPQHSQGIRGVLATGLAFASVFALSCSSSSSGRDPGLEGLDVVEVKPALAVPGTEFLVEGRSFVDGQWGTSRVVFEGSFEGDGGSRDVRVAAAANFLDFDELRVNVDDDFLAQMGTGSGTFRGDVFVEVDSSVDGETYRSRSIPKEIAFRDFLEPAVTSIDSGQLIFVNDKIGVLGDGFLLTESEGQTVAVVNGCFVDDELGGSCVEVAETEIPLVPVTRFDRTMATFAFHPRIVGIKPGAFTGTVVIRNRQPVASSDSAASAIQYDLTEPIVFSVSPTAVSLGQFADIVGGGFVGNPEGGGEDGLTLLELVGTFTPSGQTDGAAVDLVLIPQFLEGRVVRYVLNEDDSLGQSIDLRRVTGSFVGNITPVTEYGGDTVRGGSSEFNLGIAPVKQVVYLNFRPTYVESLRAFGIRAVDRQIRDRIAEVVQRDYATVNLEVRLERPDDFSLYAEVDISGPDPNGLGLLGYDNTPGKDTQNERLFDRIGGVNATTQEDGFPGFGGVFIESLFAFSKNPGSYADSIGAADDLFDQTFDAFRPDRDGTAITGVDLAGAGITILESGASCPSAGSRGEKISCAVWVLGSLIGTTLSHEIGHSLGLANPFGEGFHNSSDEANRLMDSGGDRPFAERAELNGLGPARFCTTEYDYLREILPTAEPMDTSGRPSCF